MLYVGSLFIIYFCFPYNKKDTYNIEMSDLYEQIKRTHFLSKLLKFNLVMED